jgi:hypothetical protein
LSLNDLWVSSTCHCRPPKNLKSQHKPRFGQPRQTQGVSQICPLTLLTSSNKFKLTRILRPRTYYIIYSLKLQGLHKF